MVNAGIKAGTWGDATYVPMYVCVCVAGRAEDGGRRWGGRGSGSVMQQRGVMVCLELLPDIWTGTCG